MYEVASMQGTFGVSFFSPLQRRDVSVFVPFSLASLPSPHRVLRRLVFVTRSAGQMKDLPESEGKQQGPRYDVLSVESNRARPGTQRQRPSPAPESDYPV